VPDDDANVIVCDRHFLGREYRYFLETPSGKKLQVRTTLNTQILVGTRVKLSVASSSIQIFSTTAPISENTPALPSKIA
jgi:iron(III) transport system ATP-binding protein